MADDESSNNDEDLALCNLLEQQHIQTQHNEDRETVLASFRQEWRRELENANSRRGSSASPSQLSPFKAAPTRAIEVTGRPKVGHVRVENKTAALESKNGGQNFIGSQGYKASSKSTVGVEKDSKSANDISTSSAISTSGGNEQNVNTNNIDERSDIEKKAAEYFNKATELERTGRLYEAIQFYRRAMTLVPDIEFRVHWRNLDVASEVQRAQNEVIDNFNNNDDISPSYGNDNEEDCDLVARFRSFMSPAHPVCIPQFSQEAAHISCLPPEMMDKILHWVIADDLDLRSLEKTGAVCRGFYMLSRSPELWRKISIKLWGTNITDYHPYASWRDMVLLRSHPRFDGCYISCTTYFQAGESSFQDVNYQPWHVVKYYRFIRFFPDGDVMMLTSSDEPQKVVHLFRGKDCKNPQILFGHYHIHDNKVYLEFSRRAKDLIRNRHKNRRHVGSNNDIIETKFYVELDIDSVNKKPNWKLNWAHYTITSQYHDHRKTTSHLEVTNSDNFPSLYYSRVKSYCAEAKCPLK